MMTGINATLAATAALGFVATAGCSGEWPPRTCGSEEINADTFQVQCGCRDRRGYEAIATWNFCYEGPGATAVDSIVQCNAAATDLTIRGGGVGVACGPIGGTLHRIGTDNCPATVGLSCEELTSVSEALIDASAQPLHGWANPYATFAGNIDSSRSFVEVTVRDRTASPALTGEIYVTGGDCPGADCDMRVDGLQLWADPFALHGVTVTDIELVDWGAWDGQKRADDTYKFSAADARVKLAASIDGEQFAMVGEPVGIPGGQFYTSATPLPGGGIAPAGYMTIEGTFAFDEGEARVFLVFIFGNGAPNANVSSEFVVCDVVAEPECGWVFDGSWSRDFHGGPVAEYHWYDADGDLLGAGATLAPDSLPSPDPISYPIFLTVVDAAGFVASTAIDAPEVESHRTGEHGWVWANKASSASYAPAAGYQFNSTGASNTVTRSGRGNYTVRFAGLGGSGGNVQVTAYGSGASYCKSAGWWNSGSDLLAAVRCFGADGSPANARFDALFNRERITGASGTTSAYLWANWPTVADYAPAAAYSYNDTGAVNRVRRDSTGHYTVALPGIAGDSASVLVTAYGSTSDRCKTAGWYGVAGTMLVTVRCTDAAGSPADSTFNLSYTARGVPGLDSSHGEDNAGAYAWANDSASASYAPHSSYAGNDLGGELRARRIATGVYKLDIPRAVAVGSDTVLVTAYGMDSAHCKVGGWSRGSTKTTATVRCFDAAGSPSDARFTATYVTSNDR